MKKLKFFIIHCTYTPPGMEVTKEMIEQWHLVERGWSVVGYSDMILPDGRIINLHEFDQDEFVDPWEITNGVKGLNGVARHVVYVGGMSHNRKPMDTRTRPQKDTILTYCKHMVHRYPDILIGGHSDFAAKDCPCFNVGRFLDANGVPKRNIYNYYQP